MNCFASVIHITQSLIFLLHRTELYIALMETKFDPIAKSVGHGTYFACVFCEI